MRFQKHLHDLELDALAVIMCVWACTRISPFEVNHAVCAVLENRALRQV